MIDHKKYAIAVKDLTVAYHEKPVIWDLDFFVPKGTLLGIVGPNGSGKTTLLKSILGIIQPTTGCLKIFGEPYNRTTHNIAYVPQKSSVDWSFPTDVFDVVLMGRYGHLSLCSRPTKKDYEIARQALETVNMSQFATRHISQLSGGQQQRVFLARALAQQADIFILDEPFAGIDIVTEQIILQLLQHLRNQGKTIIVVHHDITTVKKYFDWTFLMNIKHIALGPTETVLTPENIANTFQSYNLFNENIND
ncbi:MAG TPA: metal ABC transporter ATP-binding protein [Candidatus Saccharimonadales bacterium]|nr:metal ABC transporter ATP-binding protein [Candidatus Saccharimonadales bacterium]